MATARARPVNKWAKSNRSYGKHATNAHELYPTPEEATATLLRVEDFRPRVWEPASGLGHISKVLEASGREVVSTDLYAEKHGYGEVADFLEAETAAAEDIVTNPPYSLLRYFMVKALQLPGVRKVAFLTPFDALCIQANVAIFRELGFPKAHVLIPALSIDCGPERGIIKSVFNHAWLVWDTAERRDHVELRHVDWREAVAASVGDLL